LINSLPGRSPGYYQPGLAICRFNQEIKEIKQNSLYPVSDEKFLRREQSQS
jgi:hypothetical protein